LCPEGGGHTLRPPPGDITARIGEGFPSHVEFRAIQYRLLSLHVLGVGAPVSAYSGGALLGCVIALRGFKKCNTLGYIVSCMSLDYLRGSPGLMVTLMRSLGLLLEEHRVMERALSLLENASLRLLRGEPVDLRVFPLLLRFLREFDLQHVEKEERVFSYTRRRVSSDILENLVSEHRLVKESLRTLLRMLEEALESMDEGRVRSVIGDVLGYVKLRRTHISRIESNILNLATSILNEDDDRRLLEEFEEVEATTLKPGGVGELLKLLEEAELLLRS
jgi:hemerythrin-like domain-containing protein